MRYVIIGAGAIGGSIGGRLHEGGHDVVLVARGAHAEAIRQDGLRLVTPQGPQRLPIPVVTGPEDIELRADDVLVLATKTQDTVAALDQWSHRPVAGGTASDKLPVVTAQNGVANERMALRRFRRVYGTCVILPSTYLTPGEVIAPCGPYTGLLIMGRYPAGTDGPVEEIASDLGTSHFLAPVVPDVMRWKYAKLLNNLANAVDAVCGEDSPVLRHRAITEGRAVLAAAGIDCAGHDEFAEMRGTNVVPRNMDGGRRSSSWQSIVRGTGTVESDYLNGEIVLLGRTHGVPTPVNDTLLTAAHESVRLGRKPGELTVDDLIARIDR
ncbi:ketopantoate reductase family protein [Actinokineospora enzanensis]|uniref:ketopantoate reductase family protein n=1 Tax=Actinokineospora enzanensis TaxID=155975 RepID=UPI00036CD376|nr:2-dehydropantoate 2-reductase N-terminal domain-containing protein [Actinokineospora enzanensis]